MNNVATEALYKYNKPCSIKHSYGNRKMVMSIGRRKHQKEGKKKRQKRAL